MAIVDVLIPAYNAGTTVRQTIESVQRQTITDFEIVIINDGSTDDTGPIVRKMAQADARIRIYDQANGGIVEAMNAGLRFCTSEFIARLDADDICSPNRLEVQLAYLRANPAVVAVGAAVRHIDAAGEPLGSIARLGPPDLADPYRVPSIEPYIIHPFLTVRRKAVEVIGGYRQVHYAEDTDLYWRLQGQGRLVNLDDLLGDYRMHSESISGSSILNGRISAVNSQLASLSEQRRRECKRDLVFSKGNLATYKRVVTLEAMIQVASEGLDASEHQYLKAATAAKLLELAAYRPFELEASDCVFVGEVARLGMNRLSLEDAIVLKRQISGSAARIAASGRLRDALKMVCASSLPAFAARYLLRATLPDRLRRRLRRRESKNAPLK